MISSYELSLLSDAFDALANYDFKNFCNGIMTPDQGVWTALVNAAEKVNANIISAACLNYKVPTDMSRALLIPEFISHFNKALPIHKIMLLGHQRALIQ